MPLVDPTQVLLAEVAPGEQAPPTEELASPGALNTLASAARQMSSVTSLYERVMNEHTLSLPSVSGVRRPTIDLDPVEGYNPFDDIAGFEDHAMRFVRSESPTETQLIKNRIRQELADREVLSRAGGWGMASSFAFGATDPFILASMAVPAAPALAGVGRLGRIGAGIAAQAALDTAAEGVLHSQQELRTVGDSAFNIGAGALLSGILGTIATRVPKAEFEATVKRINAERAAMQAGMRVAPNAPVSGTVRLYHGGSPEGVDGPLWFTSSLQDAEGWAARSPGMKIWYVDVPEATLGGDLANGIAPLSRVELPAEIASQRRSFDMPVNSATEGFDSAGASRVVETTLEDEGVARGGQTIAKTLGKISPETRVLTSPFKSARQLVQKLVDVPYLLQKNLKGEASVRSIEGQVKRVISTGRYHAAKLIDSAFAEYKMGGGALSRGKFAEEVSTALTRGDVSDIPQVQSVVKWARKMFDEDRELLKKLGVEIGDDVVGAPSYFPRVYNFEKIVANRGDFERRLFQWFKSNPKLEMVKGADGVEEAVPRALEDAEILDEVRKAVDHILGMPTARADLNLRSKGAPLKSRVLDVPDEILAPYLERDFETVMSGYLRSMAPEVEMRKAGMSSPALEKELQDVTDEYHRLIDTVKDTKKLDQQYRRAMDDLTLLRDRLMGNVGVRGGRHVQWVRAARIARTYNYVRLLGSQMLSSMSDYGRLVARYGLPRTVSSTAKFLGDWNLNKMARVDAHRIGTALEMVVDSRTAQIGDIADELPRTRFDKGMQWASNKFSRVSLMSPWNATMKSLTALLEQDSILRFVNKTDLTAVERAKLAAAGISQEDAAGIRAMFAQHGEEVDGLLRARTELWTDQRLARLFEDNVVKVADEIVVTRGIGDLPAFMDNETIKTMLQFRSFAMASVNRTMIPLAQGLAMGDAKTAQGIATMLSLGMMTYYAKEYAAGRQPDTDPERLIAEAFNWSGLMGFIPDLWDPIAAFSPEDEEGENILPRFSRFKSRSPTESLMGPTFGTGLDTVAGSLKGFLDGDLEQKDIERFRRLLPAQNLFYVRRLFNAIEGEVGEMLGAEGATTRTFEQRLTEEKPTK